METMISRFRKYPFLILLISVAAASRSVSASDLPQSGDRYEIISPLYLNGVYKNLNDRKINKEMAVGIISAAQISGPEIAFRTKVSTGTIMAIIGPAPKRRHFSLFTPNTQEYFVQLEPDPSQGLDVKIRLKYGIEGNLDGLNPEIFRRLQEKSH